jgi:6-phosphogluconolactonase
VNDRRLAFLVMAGLDSVRRPSPDRLTNCQKGNRMTNESGIKMEILADPASLARRVAEWMLAAATAKDGVFAIALSGGATPRLLYEHLADPCYRDLFPWSRTHWFWGDERFVPHDASLSNYRMVQEALLAHAPIPAANIHAVPTDASSPEAAASAYERELQSFYGAERLDPARPLFDVTLLGLGPDGHTASLFPGTAVLAERDRWVAAVVGAKAEARITLTYPALESSRNAAFLVTGSEKRAMLDRLRRGDDALPAARLHPTGALWIFSDASAA